MDKNLDPTASASGGEAPLRSRELRFRVWNGEVMSESFHPWEMKADACGGWMDSQGTGLWYPGCEAHNLKWMQFTGLKDRHGVEIYEGDILSLFVEQRGFFVANERKVTGEYLKAPVVFGYGQFYLDAKNAPTHWLSICADAEVVGNIFQP